MPTTAIVVEILIVGFQAMVWVGALVYIMPGSPGGDTEGKKDALKANFNCLFEEIIGELLCGEVPKKQK